MGGVEEKGKGGGMVVHKFSDNKVFWNARHTTKNLNKKSRRKQTWQQTSRTKCFEGGGGGWGGV